MVGKAGVSNWNKVGVILLGIVAVLLAYAQITSYQNKKCAERAMGDFLLIEVIATRWSFSEGCEYFMKSKLGDDEYEWEPQHMFEVFKD